ncbi:putative bifunctional diguanylate cyclase/phosphodiesterase [Erwinia persicina]|uniref:putative bifunctional diguanylate cyclase/phosphodiesterase n=1 Tax=Erwinia persicina TaxID=55211 RepID=UPI001782AF16|nr:bifunctional diguanylate cyclase/phosphodiesterase [Erwinia persicina]MBD8213311.1 bifunctional diguanylate cyclase/phosphodiesterase [Erwinia persicina]
MKISDSFRHHFIKDVLIPLTFVLLLTSAAGISTLLWATSRANQDETRQQQQIVDSALSHSVAGMQKQQRSLTHWPPLAERLAQTPHDLGWLNENVGAWLSGMFDHQLIYLLDASGHPVYLWEDGRNVPPDRFAHVAYAVRPFQQSLTHRHSPGTARSDRTGFVLIDDAPAIVTLGEISADAADRGTYSMLSIRRLDSDWLQSLARRGLLHDLRFTPRVVPAGTPGYFTLKTPQGVPIGSLAWTADRPGTRMLEVLAPAMALVLLVIVLISVVMIRRLWLSSMRLSDSLLQLGASEAQAQHLAFHDVLTGLPNRALVDERLNQALVHLPRQQEKLALLLLDLDRFKTINDTYGHQAGDELIVEVAHRLNGLVRHRDTVGRLGGDEFVIIQQDITTSRETHLLCQRIIDALNRPFTLLGNETWIGVSIGVVLAPDDATERMEMLRKADIALYEAKNQGRGQYRIFEHVMDESLKTRQQIGADLRLALQTRRDLSVHYQPLVEISGQRIVGFEALVRWQHPVQGMISPTEFIPIAEEMGIIAPLGEWVLREACQTARQWPDLTLAVNVSPLQFRAPGFVERIKAIVSKEQVSPSRIELEITEGVLIDDEKRAKGIIDDLRAAGFRIALDDFGTGYSSLNYLSHFSVDKIKIDRSFTQSLGMSGNAAAVIESVVRLGHAMGLTVTAEGVENRGQMKALARAGCNHLQGYLFSEAVPREQIAGLVNPREAS